jgi:hypothetical protein
MVKKSFILPSVLLILYLSPVSGAQIIIENQYYSISLDPQTGAITSLLVKANRCELIEEERLVSNFRICLPLKEYRSNYIDGMDQQPVEVTSDGTTITVRFSGMSSPQGEFPIDLSYSVSLFDDYVSFRSRLTNHHPEPVSEFWFPRIGGWKRFGDHRDAKLATPDYNSNSRHDISLFRQYPGVRDLGAEAAEWSLNYPPVVAATMVMPWWDIYDEATDIGLYLAYHDPIFRISTWHTYLMPNRSGGRDAWLSEEEVPGQPVGLIFSHVRYPYIHSGETLESGEFIIRAHQGDWHSGSRFYREWFLAHFPFDHSDSWLRKQGAWFSSIIYEQEDKIIADFQRYDKWTADAQKYGIHCYELIGWNSGGLERGYPDYRPEEKLGGREGFRRLMKSIDSRGGKCLVFNNYNILDQNTEWYRDELHQYRQQDGYGKQDIWMGWGQSTLIARNHLNVRYAVRSSVTPEMEKILSDYFLELVRDGAHGFQMDKLCVASALDFNPLNTLKPDVALCEGLVQAIDRLYRQCLEINPDFRMASEFASDRLLPYFDVALRSAGGLDISTFRYVFPEWTSAVHILSPRDFRGVNGAILTGAVICVEPDTYQGSLDQPQYRELGAYIREVERIRRSLADIIFLGDYFDELDAAITEVTGSDQSTRLHYRVHGDKDTGRHAMVVVNDSAEPARYAWKFLHREILEAELYTPFEAVRTVKQDDILEIGADGLQILVEAEP